EWHRLGNGGDVSPDIVSQFIAGTFHRGSPQNPYSSAVPIGRPQAVKANVVGITPAFDPVSLHLRQVEYGIPLWALQQQLAVVCRAFAPGVHGCLSDDA